MRTFLALLALILATSFASAAPVTGRLILRESGFVPNPVTLLTNTYDIYEVQLNNPNEAITTAELSFPGSNYAEAAGVTFKAGTEIPNVFGFDVPDTFFVVPDGVLATDVLAVGTIDDETLLSSTFTLPGSQPLIPSGVSTIAVLTVIEGTVLDVNQFIGRFAVQGVFLPDFIFIPEPTAMFLFSFGLVGLAVRSRCP